MILPSPSELDFFGVYYPGVPNRECLVFQSNIQINIAQFGVLVSWKVPDETTIPLWDNFYWFGEINVNARTWIVLMTCGGEFTIEKHPSTGEPLYRFYWGRKKTVFENPNTFPMLIQLGAIKLGERQIPKALPQ